MAQIIHLGKVRKARARAAAQMQADANAVRHGRTRSERLLDDAERRLRDATLDGARRGGEPGPGARPDAEAEGRPEASDDGDAPG